MSEVITCNVAGCPYAAHTKLADFGDFPVCALHDAPQTYAILARYERPSAFWCDERPVVMPGGPLAEAHLVPVPSTTAWDPTTCAMLAAVPDGPSKRVSPAWDLTR